MINPVIENVFHPGRACANAYISMSHGPCKRDVSSHDSLPRRCREFYRAPSRLLTSAVRAATSAAAPEARAQSDTAMEQTAGDPQREPLEGQRQPDGEPSQSVFARLGEVAIAPSTGGQMVGDVVQKQSVWERLRFGGAPRGIAMPGVCPSVACSQFQHLCNTLRSRCRGADGASLHQSS